MLLSLAPSQVCGASNVKAHDIGYLLPIEKNYNKRVGSHKAKLCNLLRFGKAQELLDSSH